ncbi:hypothetical protein OL599_19875 [Rhodovastum sp. RN2-1]|uniref:Uncharacterized protein n=1 Tax=Limobrevibacterium gyesilva TaxID=2991712 RepID=A0AA41YUP6_9PROT|nr:hypothetical protein [Limobrevibacterium gyesilva]
MDARVPVVFGAVGDAGAGDALLIEGDAPAPAGRTAARFAATALHVAGCLCCLPRSAAGAALGALFLARARGEVPFFRRVVAVAADTDAVRAALADDPLAAGRFRLAEKD